MALFAASAFRGEAPAQTYTFTTLAGIPNRAGFADGAGSSAQFNLPSGIVVDSRGFVFVGEVNNAVIRRITPAGVVSTWVPQYTGAIDLAVDSADHIFGASYFRNAVLQFSSTGAWTVLAGKFDSPGTQDGTGANARFRGPEGIVTDTAGNIFIADSLAHCIRRISPIGEVTTVAGLADTAGTADGIRSAARFRRPSGIAIDRTGMLYVADSENNAIRRITPDGAVTTFAGFPGQSGRDDGTSAARFDLPVGVAIDQAGNILVADMHNSAIRLVTPAGVVSTVGGVAGHASHLDGVGDAARFSAPSAIAVDAASNLYIADAGTHVIRKGTLSGVTPTITVQPASRTGVAGETVTLQVTATGPGLLQYQWRRNGELIPGATSPVLTLPALSTSDSGQYDVLVHNGWRETLSESAVVGIVGTQKVTGGAQEVATGIQHPNGNIYDQVILTGPTAMVMGTPGKVIRVSFLDLNDDIVQAEYSGAGTMTISLASATGPDVPVKYNQAFRYMKGHASFVIAGADETTHFSIFSVGRITAVNQDIFRDVPYDGVADIASIAIASTNGKFGSVRMGDGGFFAHTGNTGIIAPGVVFQGPIYLRDLNGFDSARAFLLLGGSADLWVTGGNLQQANNHAVEVSGVTRIEFKPGTDSHGIPQAAQANRARYEDHGVDISDRIVVNPSP